MRQHIIHFTGHDNSGKSSIGKALSLQLEIPYFRNPHNAKYHDGYINNITYLHAEGLLEFDLLSQTNYSLIRDRNYVCEIAYSKYYNRPTDTDFLIELHRAYCSSFQNFYILYCFKNQFREKFEDEYVKEKEIPELKKCYEAALRSLPYQERILWLDTTDENLEQQIKTIKDFIQW